MNVRIQAFIDSIPIDMLLKLDKQKGTIYEAKGFRLAAYPVRGS